MIRWNGLEIDAKAGEMRRGGKTVRFVSRGQHVYDATLAFRIIRDLVLTPRPRSRLDLFTMLYEDDPEGGPLDTHVVQVTLSRMRGKLNRLGLVLHSTRGYPRRYWLVDKFQDPEMQ
jgi:hypothetical protein